MTQQDEALSVVQEILAPQTTWKLIRIIGAGGGAYVLEVEHTVLHVRRAMKFIHTELLQYKSLIDRFETEARIAFRLDHPNLVKTHDMGRVGRFPYIIMDLVSGGSIEDHLLAYGKMPARQAVEVVIAVLRGLQVAHDAGIVHRDIKPQNILFKEDGTPQIIDFGIARVEEEAQGHTRVGAKMGTPAYMAPEQFYGELHLIDHRTDIHGVGVVLYTLLTMGRLSDKCPFHAQVTEHPERLDPVHQILRSVILKATAKLTTDRYETAAAMANELEWFVNDGLLPVDPEDTPKLGSAPAFKKAKAEAAVKAKAEESVASPRFGGTMVPSSTQMEVPDARLMDDEVPVQTWTDPSRNGFTSIPGVDRRRPLPVRAIAGVVGTLIVLLIGIGVWYTRLPDKIDTVIEPTIPVVVEVSVPEPTPELIPVVVTPEPTPEPEPVVEVEVKAKTKATVDSREPAKAKVVVSHVSDQEVTITRKTQVRLILKGPTIAEVKLSGEGGNFTIKKGSRDVPPGVYDVSIRITGSDVPVVGKLTVTEGLNVIECDDRFFHCKGIDK